MNRSIVIYVLGYILKTEGVLMSLPCLIALIYREKRRMGIFYSCHDKYSVRTAYVYEEAKGLCYLS